MARVVLVRSYAQRHQHAVSFGQAFTCSSCCLAMRSALPPQHNIVMWYVLCINGVISSCSISNAAALGAVMMRLVSGLRPHRLCECAGRGCRAGCSVCGDFIPTRGDGRIEWRENPFWKNTHCPAHRCSCCLAWQRQSCKDISCSLRQNGSLCRSISIDSNIHVTPVAHIQKEISLV